MEKGQRCLEKNNSTENKKGGKNNRNLWVLHPLLLLLPGQLLPDVLTGHLLPPQHLLLNPVLFPEYEVVKNRMLCTTTKPFFVIKFFYKKKLKIY